MMLDPSHPLVQLLHRDRRYQFEAYLFVFEALNYAQNVLRLGRESASEPGDDPAEEGEGAEGTERHVSGQELCEAIRRFALDQYGYMAKAVLNSWGVHTTADFGEIVFNLIEVGQMRKTPQDRREDFDGVFDFDVALRQEYRIDPARK